MLPSLRQDLSLHMGPDASDGSPTWTLHDPAANRFYQLSWSAFEILSRWFLNNPQAVIDSVNSETTLSIQDHDLLGLLQFLSAHHLLELNNSQDSKRLEEYLKLTKLSKAKWLLKNYLFLRVPLVRPQKFLDSVSPYIHWVFSYRFWLGIILVASTGIYLASRQWDEFIHTFGSYKTLSGILSIGIALSFAKILHEFGHAFTAHRYGCRVPAMGIAFLVMWPVLYTDTNEAWKVVDKRKRLAIGAAGMLSELALAAVATLLWSFLSDGPLRAGMFLLATTTWLITLAINASPFMRFDGYFLLSDYLDVPNLHSRSFELARWWLREKLFGWQDAPPEKFTPGKQKFLIAFAFITWVYRLTLFLGIAFLVYHAFFKALGIFLMMVELIWFIGLPIYSEFKAWWRRRSQFEWNRNMKRTAIAFVVLIAIFFIPWRSHIKVPAVLGAQEEQGLYAITAAKVLTSPAAVGQLVKAGEVLIELESPDLHYQLEKAKNKAKMTRWQLDQQPLDAQLRQEGMALRERWDQANSELNGLQKEIARLTVRAPFNGKVVEVSDGLVPGAWVKEREKLFHVVGNQQGKGEAFIDEAAYKSLRPETLITFIPDQFEASRVHCKIDIVDPVNLPAIDSPYVASIYGGSISVQKDKDAALVPTEAVFRVRLNKCDSVIDYHELRGVAYLDSDFTSRAGKYFDKLMTGMQKEMNF